MSYFIIPRSGEEWGFHKEETGDRGNGRRTRVNQRRGKEAAIKDKRRISGTETADISLLSSQQEADRYVERLYWSHHFLKKHTSCCSPNRNVTS